MSKINTRSRVIPGLFALMLAALPSLAWFASSVFSAGERADDGTYQLATETEAIRVYSLTANDMVFNPSDQKIYASLPSTVGSTGNSILPVDPATGAFGTPVYVGSEPNKLALSDDGHSMYVALDGAFAIRRFNTATQTAGGQFTTFYSTSGRFKVADMAVSPGNPDLVAIARQTGSTSGQGVAAFNDGFLLPLTTPGSGDSSDSIAFSAAGNIAFGTGRFSGFKRINITGSGASVATSSTLATNTKIKFSGGKVFSSAGHVIDPINSTLLGTFPSATSIAFVPDAAVGRAYYLVKDATVAGTWILKAYDINTFAQIGSLSITGVNGDAASMLRWGANGLAFRTTAGQLFLIQTTLIPSGEPIPTVTPTPTPAVTPTPTPFATSVGSIRIPANNVAYNPVNQKMYLSVPSSAGLSGNSITIVDPLTETTENSVYIGSEPNKLVFSSDNQKLYVGLDGAREIREFNVVSQTPGIQFPVGLDVGGPGGGDGPFTMLDMAASPDIPDQIAVARCSTVSSPCYRGASIIAGGVQRPETRGSSNSVTYGADSSKLYGTSSFGQLETMGINDSGLTTPIEAPFDSSTKIRYYNGLIYGSRGQVIDPVSRGLAGAFNLGDATGQNLLFAIDGEHNRIFFLVTGSGMLQVRAFELDTFRPAGTIFTPGAGVVTGFTRWSNNGLAVSHSNGPVILIRSTLVSPADPVPVYTPTPTPTPTPTATPFPVFIRRIDQPNNDMELNPADGKLYVTVPSAATNGTQNTIARFDPSNGNYVGSTFIGNDPGRIAMGDDGQTAYIGLSTISSVRRYDMATHRAGMQFPLDQNGGFFNITDMGVVPGNPDLLVVGAGAGLIFDNGVRRPNIPLSNGVHFADIGPVKFASSSIVYGFNSFDTGHDVYKVAIDINGMSTVSSTRNLIPISTDLKLVEGKLFSAAGRVADPETNRMTGSFPSSSGGTVAVDTVSRKVFIAGATEIGIFNMDNYLKIGSITYPNIGSPASLTRWGVNGLAMRIHGASGAIILIQSPAVSTAVPIPTGLNLSAATYSSGESSSSRSVTVTRTGEINTAVTVNYQTSDQTAVAGSDYTATSGTLSFAAGETTKTFSIPILNDNVFELQESFIVTLSGPTGAEVYLLTPSSAVVTINDNDPRPLISDENTTVNEGSQGNSATANVMVRLTNPSSETVSVNYATANGTAIAGADYQATNGTLNFAPLETVKIVPITVFGDDSVEGTEAFFLNLSEGVNGTIGAGQATITIVDDEAPRRAAFDFDGDGKSDVSVFRPSDGNWYLLQSTAGYTGTHFGIAADKLAPADYDGDGKTDIAVFRDGAWYLQQSTAGFLAYNFGQAGDIPQPADFNGDGKAELCVFRPSDGGWYKLDLNGYVFTAVTFGQNGDKPVVGDYDGDGTADPAVYRGGSWYILGSTQGYYGVSFGIATDKPVQADYDGDGKTDQAVVRDGFWYILQSTAGYTGFQWGNSTDLPIAADYDGDGKADVSVFRDGFWYMQQSAAGYTGVSFGSPADKPVPNSFVQ